MQPRRPREADGSGSPLPSTGKLLSALPAWPGARGPENAPEAQPGHLASRRDSRDPQEAGRGQTAPSRFDLVIGFWRLLQEGMLCPVRTPLPSPASQDSGAGHVQGGTQPHSMPSTRLGHERAAAHLMEPRRPLQPARGHGTGHHPAAHGGEASLSEVSLDIIILVTRHPCSSPGCT